ncbi:uncharacterized protein [Diabrotica undecimpunctata]|uniref:uncharacterized protein n=1 Tax=Diabrotica undecimpunctata TaxID=50387 RepID=UPI003B63B691
MFLYSCVQVQRPLIWKQLQVLVLNLNKFLTIRSDQGTNFKIASNEIIKLAHSFAQNLSLNWDFNCADVPHFNRLTKAMVKSFKNHIYCVLGAQVLIYEEFYTLITQIKAVLNCSHLYAASSDPNDLQALAPGHFLIFKPVVDSIADPDLSVLKINESLATNPKDKKGLLEKIV